MKYSKGEYLNLEMKNIKPFGPSIGKTKISKKFLGKLNNEFDIKSNLKKIDYSSKLASQIKNELKISNSFIKKYLENKKDIEILGDKINDWWTQHKENLKETFLIIKNV